MFSSETKSFQQLRLTGGGSLNDLCWCSPFTSGHWIFSQRGIRLSSKHFPFCTFKFLPGLRWSGAPGWFLLRASRWGWCIRGDQTVWSLWVNSGGVSSQQSLHHEALVKNRCPSEDRRLASPPRFVKTTWPWLVCEDETSLSCETSSDSQLRIRGGFGLQAFYSSRNLSLTEAVINKDVMKNVKESNHAAVTETERRGRGDQVFMFIKLVVLINTVFLWQLTKKMCVC